MALAFVAATCNNASSDTPDVSHTATAGNFLVLWVGGNGTATITGPAGWTAVAELAVFSSYRARLFYRIATGSESYACTLSASEAWAISVSEFSGMLNPPNLRTFAQREENTATPSSGPTGVNSVIGDLVFSAYADNNGAITSQPSGYTSILPGPGGVLHYGAQFNMMGGVAFKAAAAAGTEDPQWSIDGVRFSGVGAYVFEAAAAAAAPFTTTPYAMFIRR